MFVPQKAVAPLMSLISLAVFLMVVQGLGLQAGLWAAAGICATMVVGTLVRVHDEGDSWTPRLRFYLAAFATGTLLAVVLAVVSAG